MTDIFEQIGIFLQQNGTAIIALGASIATIIKSVKEFGNLRRECVDLKDLDDVKKQMASVLRENAELKADLKHTMNRLNHVLDEKENT